MHSIDSNGLVCVNLNDYNELSDSIRWREKIDYLIKALHCPQEISHFSITLHFPNGQRYYLSNLYLWAIPYRTEGLYRGDIDHDPVMYHGKEYFIQSALIYDAMQTPIVQILETRYGLYTTFAMVRQCLECDIIIEAYHSQKISDPIKLYYDVRESFERFIYRFLDAMSFEITSSNVHHESLKIFNDAEYRKNVITRNIKEINNYQITPKELQCLKLFSKGMTMKQTATALFVSTETINSHTKSIRKKLSCKNMAEAIFKAFRLRLLM